MVKQRSPFNENPNVIKLSALHDRLSRGLEQAKSGELAEGTGREAMERAFERAKRESDNHGATK